MHQEGYCHGDLLLRNLLFNNKSRLLDFDLSGVADKKRYPSGYNTEVSDGDRHPDAVPNELVKIAHDRYTIASIMSMFTVDGSDNDKLIWQHCIDQIKSSSTSLSRITVLLDPIKMLKLLPTIRAVKCIPTPCGAGSPARNQQKRKLKQILDKK